MSLRTLRNCKKGFTLIEVLVSIGLVSVLMMLIWQDTSQSVKSKDKIEKRNAIYHFARVTVNKMTQDITMAFLLKGPAQLGAKQGSPQSKTVFKGDEEKMNFDSLSHLRLFQDSKESEETEIGYKTERDPDNRDRLILFRRESKTIDNNPDEGGVWVPLAYKLKGLKLEYYDGVKFDWKTSWNSETSEKDLLPRAVRVTLTFEDPRNKENDMPLTTTVLLGMKNAIEF